MNDTPNQLLRRWLQQQLHESAFVWLDQQLAGQALGLSDKQFYITLGMISRRLGKSAKQDLKLDPADLDTANQARSGWDPRGWSLGCAARILVLSELGGTGMTFAKRFTDLVHSADLVEAIDLYRGLPLYPSPGLLEVQAAEGVRTHIRAQFEAIAHQSPYPKEQFNEQRWNNMVVKTLFIDSTLRLIQGLDERANPELAKILCDYAHERWAAGRQVSPELWRCVGPFAEAEVLADLQRVITTGNDTECKAAALALAASPDPQAQDILKTLKDIPAAIVSGSLSWRTLNQEF